MHRVYLSSPGDLEPEKQLCRKVISEVNERLAMPAKVLMVSVGLPQEGAIDQFRSAVADNIRQCRYYIQVFQDDWGPRNLGRKMFYLAADGRADESLPITDVVVFLKDAPRETDAEILAFRKELEELDGIRLFHFKDEATMAEQLRPVIEGWCGDILASLPDGRGSDD